MLAPFCGSNFVPFIAFAFCATAAPSLRCVQNLSRVFEYFRKKIVGQKMKSFIVTALVVLCVAITCTRSCHEMTIQNKRGKVLAIECCQDKALLKENGKITAEMTLKEAGCADIKKPQKDEKQPMRDWQIMISFLLVAIFVGIVVLIVRALLRLFE